MRNQALPPLYGEFFRYQTANPQCVFGRTMITLQVTVPAGGAPVLIAEALRPQLFMITNIDSGNAIYIGGNSVTLNSGFPITPSTSPLVFGLMENTKLYACAQNQVTAYIFNLGV